MKIFVTVGTQLPFDRLVKEVDQWAATREGIDLVAQIGNAKYVPQHLEYYPMLASKEFNLIFNEADLLISHAGMGVILSALVNNKPLLVMPRRKKLNEVNTDHQLATAKAFEQSGLLNVAWDNQQLKAFLDQPGKISSRKSIGPHASEELIKGIKDFIETF